MLLDRLDGSGEITRDLLKNGSDGLKSLVNCVAKKTEEAVLIGKGHKTPVDLIPEKETIVDQKEVLFDGIFTILSKKFKKKSLYSKEDLFSHMKFVFEKYINGKNKFGDKVQVGIYFGFKTEKGENGYIDYLDKTSGRKKFYKESDFNNLFGIQVENFFSNLSLTKKNDIYYQNDDKGFLVINSEFDSGYYIIHISGLDEFEKEIVSYLKEKIVDLVRDKISLILAKYIDTMTGCTNSTYINEHNNIQNLSIAELDISDLKRLNDVYGHDNGDLAIKHFGKILKSCVRKDEGKVVRISGDEFGIIVKRDNNGGHNIIWDNIFSRLEQLKNEDKLKIKFKFNDKDIEYNYGYVYGVCKNNDEEGILTLGQCLEKADKNLSVLKGTSGLTSRLIAILKDYSFSKQVEAIGKALVNLFGNYSASDRLDIIKKLSKTLNVNNTKNKE